MAPMLSAVQRPSTALSKEGGDTARAAPAARRRPTTEELVARHANVAPFLVKKWVRIFSHFFDRNSSQQVDWGDFYLVVRKVRDIYGAESQQMELARRGLAALWEGLCRLADADDDQLVSLDEWVAMLARLAAMAPDARPAWFRDYQHFMFQLFDVSNDGVLDVAEYADGMQTYGFAPQESHAIFGFLTADENGVPVVGARLSPAQWAAFFNELFFATDPAARGNSLFGRLQF